MSGSTITLTQQTITGVLLASSAAIVPVAAFVSMEAALVPLAVTALVVAYICGHGAGRQRVETPPDRAGGDVDWHYGALCPGCGDHGVTFDVRGRWYHLEAGRR